MSNYEKSIGCEHGTIKVCNPWGCQRIRIEVETDGPTGNTRSVPDHAFCELDEHEIDILLDLLRDAKWQLNEYADMKRRLSND